MEEKHITPLEINFSGPQLDDGVSTVFFFARTLSWVGINKVNLPCQRTFARCAIVWAVLDAIINMGVQTRTYRGVYFGLVWFTLCMLVAISFEVWLPLIKDVTWKELFDKAQRADQKTFLTRMYRLGRFGISMAIIMVGLFVVGWIIPMFDGIFLQDNTTVDVWYIILVVRFALWIVFCIPFVLVFVTSLNILDVIITFQEINVKLLLSSVVTNVLRGIDASTPSMPIEHSESRDAPMELSILVGSTITTITTIEDNSPRTPTETVEILPSDGIENITPRHHNSNQSSHSSSASTSASSKRGSHRSTALPHRPWIQVSTFDFATISRQLTDHLDSDQRIAKRLSGVIMLLGITCVLLNSFGGLYLYRRWTQEQVDDQASVHVGIPWKGNDIVAHYFLDCLFVVLGMVIPGWFLLRMGRMTSRWDVIGQSDTYMKRIPKSRDVHPQWFRDLATFLLLLDRLPHGYYIYLYRISAFRSWIIWISTWIISIVLILL